MQQREQIDRTESQDEEDSIISDTRTISKRRTSGTRDNDSKRDEATPTRSKEIIHSHDPERRSSQSNRSGALWRSRAPDNLEYQTVSGSAEEQRSIPQQHQVYSDDGPFVRRRVSNIRITEDPSHIDSNTGPDGSGVRTDQQMDDYRMRPQDSTPMMQERGLSSPPSIRQDVSMKYRGAPAQSRHGAPSQLPESVSMAIDTTFCRPPGQDHSGVHKSDAPSETSYMHPSGAQLPGNRDESRRGSGPGMYRDTTLESPTLYEPQGSASSQRPARESQPMPQYFSKEHPKAPHLSRSQPFAARSAASDPPYAYIPPRQGYDAAGGQRPIDYGALTPYADDHHRRSLSSNPYEREHPSKLQTGSSFQHSLDPHQPPSLQHPSHIARDQYSEGHAHVNQESSSTRPRHPNHLDLYSRPQQPIAPHPLSHEKYPESGDLVPKRGIQSTGSIQYLPAYQEGTASDQRRYGIHTYPSYTSAPSAQSSHGSKDLASNRRESLASLSPRQSSFRAQSMPHFPQATPLPAKAYSQLNDSIPAGARGQDLFHHDRGSDGASRHSVHTASNYQGHQDGQAQAMHGLGSGNGHYTRGSPTAPYSGHPHEPTVQRPTSVDYGQESRSSYGHGRSISSSTPSRAPYPPSSSSVANQQTRMDIRQGASSSGTVGMGPNRGLADYDSYDNMQVSQYNNTQPAPQGSESMIYEEGGGPSRGHEHDFGRRTGPSPPTSHLYPSNASNGHGPPSTQQSHPTYPPQGHYSYQHYEISPSTHVHAHPLGLQPPQSLSSQHQLHGHSQPHAGNGQTGQILGQHNHFQDYPAQHPPQYQHQPLHLHGTNPHGYPYAVSQGEEAIRSRS
ncbi:hypothetical protein BCR41DRAFT_236041 [Lobosporangium transversale]|uniref:Uncharacterized protein n=1 Tax=Lobosporangium transversale TaxID=64571 RepID=A0A1Y2GV18_9FUNG|nr:hypothetical protein BCR41DRAFT_236041 [Lobosporangium transversale]ORZ24901.1 hypothetical protein BCR41DRAFT_236041 [Lobosporangium transversale]|eukprot:XP_021883882.1 hypothetical protein BCR41DRAFT_236041 [Lobosporangium transversale]